MKIPVVILVVVLAGGLVSAQTAAGKPAAGSTSNTSATSTPGATPNEPDLPITGADAPTTTAEVQDAQNAAATPSGDVTIWDYVKMFFLLILVIGMILGVVWFMRKISGQGAGVESPIKVLHNHALSNNRSLILIEVGNEILLVGSAEGSVNLVKQITDQETVDGLRLAASEKKPVAPTGTFAGIIGTMLGQREKIRPKIDEGVGNSADFIKKQRERLKNL